MKSKLTLKSIFPLILLILLSLYTISLMIPLVWTIINSFKDKFEFAIDSFSLPTKFVFSNYLEAFTSMSVPVIKPGVGRITYPMLALIQNSLIYALGCAFFGTFTPCIVAYACAKFPYKFNKIIYAIVIFTMIFPIVGNLPSQLQLTRDLKIHDTLIGSYLMSANFLGLYFLVFYGAFKNLAPGYAEAAMVDGASQWTILTKITLPLIKPIITIVFVLVFIGYWNDYQTPMLFLPSRPTLAYGVYYFSQSTDTALSFVTMQLAGCMVVIIPIFLLFMVFKDKMIGNISFGGLKE